MLHTVIAPPAATAAAAAALDRAAFRAWLEGVPPGSIVGCADIATACPLARFLQGHGHPDARVGMGYWYEQDGFALEALPRWATAFVLAVDAVHRPVRREEALALLDGVSS